MSDKLQEVELVVKSLSDKMMKLRFIHDENTKLMAQLAADTDKLEKDRKDFLEATKLKMFRIQPVHRQKQVSQVSKQNERQNWQNAAPICRWKYRYLSKKNFGNCSLSGICIRLSKFHTTV